MSFDSILNIGDDLYILELSQTHQDGSSGWHSPAAGPPQTHLCSLQWRCCRSGAQRNLGKRRTQVQCQQDSFLLIYQVGKPFPGLLGHHFIGPSLTLVSALLNFLHGFSLTGPNISMLGWPRPPPSLISCSTYDDALHPPEGKSMAGHLCKQPGTKPRTGLGPRLYCIKMQASR